MSTPAVVSILDRIGSFFKLGAEKAIALETKLLPVEEAAATAVTVVDPALGGIFGDIVTEVSRVEQVAVAVGASTGTGAQKLAAAIPGVEQAILADPFFAGRKIPDLTKYNNAIAGLTGSVADLLKSFESSVTPVPEAAAKP